MGFVEYRYRPLNFIYTKIHGTINDQQFAEHVHASATDEPFEDLVNQVVDCRFLDNVDQLSVRGLIEAAELECAQTWTIEARLAIVIAAEPLFYGLARAYIAIVESQRTDTTIVYGLEEALAWSGYDAGQIETLLDFIRAQAGGSLLG